MSTMLSDPEVKANLAANVKRILKDRGLKQSDLARMTGEAETTISRVIQGTNVVGVGLVARIAEALDVSQDRLTAKPPAPTLQKSA